MAKVPPEVNTVAPPHAIKRRRDSTLAEKVKILELLQQPRASQSSVARNMGLSQSTISRVMKKRDEILERWNQNENPSRKRNRPFKHAKVDEALLEWLLFAKANKLPISGPILMRRAEAIAKEIGCPQFKPSNGWLWRWKERYRLFYRTEVLQGQKEHDGIVQGQDFSQIDRMHFNKVTDKDFPLSPEERFRRETSENHAHSSQKVNPSRPLLLATDYHSDDVFCAIGSLFQFRLMSSQRTDQEQQKETVCIWFCCNINGTERLQLLVTHNLPTNSVGAHSLSPVSLKTSENGHLTEDLFIEWLLNWDAKLARLERRILLVFTSLSIVPKVKLRNISLNIFPKNKMSSNILFGQQLISEFNVLYRQMLLERLQEESNTGRTPGLSQIRQLSHLSLVEASYTMNKAWLKVSPHTIKNCFQNTQSIQIICSGRHKPSNAIPSKAIPSLMLQGDKRNVPSCTPFAAGLGTYRKIIIKEESDVEQEECGFDSTHSNPPIQKVTVGLISSDIGTNMLQAGSLAQAELKCRNTFQSSKDFEKISRVVVKSEGPRQSGHVQELKAACSVIERFLSAEGQDMSIFSALQSQIQRCLANQSKEKQHYDTLKQ
ncbi:tigger transposable element-derived protein 3-like [Rhinophrynus dorsalis]